MSILYFFRPRSTPRGSSSIHGLRRSTTLYAIWASTTLPKKNVNFAILRSVLLAFKRFCARCRPPPPAGTPCALVRLRATSCAFVRPPATSCDLVRPRAPSSDLVRPCAPSCDLVCPRAPSCNLVRPRATSCALVRRLATPRRPILDLGWLLASFRASSFELRPSCVASAA